MTYIKRWIAHLTNQPILSSIFKWNAVQAENNNYGIQRDKFEHDVERIFSHYRKLGDEYSRNPAYREVMTNVGSDMMLGVSYAADSMLDAPIKNDYIHNCVVLAEVIEANRSLFEKENADREGYGTGTMGQIALEIRELKTKG